ncbi:hypothetical protein SCLCIDRAFT_1211229, partial [Scleroderma citrinum Foug A]
MAIRESTREHTNMFRTNSEALSYITRCSTLSTCHVSLLIGSREQHLDPPTATHTGKSLGEKEVEVTKESAIQFFSNIFGGGHFKGYVRSFCISLLLLPHGSENL